MNTKGRPGRIAQDSTTICERFFTAGEPLFVQHGFAKTSVEDICRDAGASKRTFYLHFNDKADFAAALLLSAGMTIVSGYLNCSAELTSASEKLNCLFNEYERLARERRVFHHLLMDPALLRSFGRGMQEKQYAPLLAVLSEILEEGIANGEFRPLDPQAVMLCIYSLLDSMYVVLPRMGGFAGALEDENLRRETRRFLFAAVLARDEEGLEQAYSTGPEVKE